MYLPDIELHQPRTLEEACETLARCGADARPLAGGTDLLVDLKTGRLRVGHLVSLRQIPGLSGAAEHNGGLRIGALTTITQLDRRLRAAPRFACLREATTQMAGPQIRNLATVGGNLAAAVPCADLPPILTAMNATVALWSCAPDSRGQAAGDTRGRAGNERLVPLEAFLAGPRQTVRREDEVLTEVRVPRPPPGFGAAYARFALRDGNAIAVAAVAASLRLDEAGVVRAARVVLGAVAPVPLLVDQVERVLVGRPAEEQTFAAVAELARDAAQPISDVRGSADFRRELVEVLTRRALAAAHRRCRETG